MSAVKDIMNVSQSMNAMAIASHNLKLAKKKRTTTKDFLGAGMANIAGTSMLQANAYLIGGL